MHDNGDNMSLTYIDVENPSRHRILKLRSDGSCRYPGFVWHNDTLYVSYYSSHEDVSQAAPPGSEEPG